MEQLISMVLGGLGVYLLVGFVFAIPFAMWGAKVVDPSAVEGSKGFKVLLIPGAMVFWPLLLRRWMRREGPPEERSAHREAAKGG
jgi:hypothetical protein